MSDMDDIKAIQSWLGAGSVNLFGLPFAGKDFHADRLIERLGGVKISGGAILRGILSDPNVKPDVRKVLDSGALIPTKDFVELALPVLEDPALDGQPLFLTAVGRMKGEEEGVMDVLQKTGHPMKAIINLEIDETTLRQRFQEHEAVKLAGLTPSSRGERADDDEVALDTRIHAFNTLTIPVIDYYRQRGLVIDVDASQSKEEVEHAIVAALVSRASTSP